MRYASLLLLLLASCASSGSNEGDNRDLPSKIDTEEYVNLSARVSADEDAPIGAFLGEVGNRVQAWNNARLLGDNERVRLLEGVLKFECLRRQDELIYQLEAGPSRNRSLAAVALGFTNSRVIVDPDQSLELIDRGAIAISPLLAAINDEDDQVAANALMGLGLLGRIDTPLEPICNALDTSPDTAVRNNASYALVRILNASKDVPKDFTVEQLAMVRQSSQLALNHSNPAIRIQASAVLGLAGDEDSIPHLGDRLNDEDATVGQAAATALARIGREQIHFKGKIARLLSGSLDRVRPTRRDTVMIGLILLAEHNFGEDTADWVSWANRLPR
ncbi:MAG: HEAT repeat protein [Planctomycetota bacterium]|jgi:HEAT repeat protein